MKQVRDMKGFTLIEALIAFIVLTIGILGGLLFHSTLVQESGESKAQIEALKVAEAQIEQIRATTGFSSATDLETALASLASGGGSSVTGAIDTYTVTWSSPVSVGSDAFSTSVNVAWSDGSIALSTYFSWLDPNNVLDADEAGGGAGGGEYDGDIPLPTGTLEALERLELADAALVTSNALRSEGNLTVYTDTAASNAIRVAVKLDDSTYIQLAELDSADNELMQISGRVYNYPFDDDRLIDEKFDIVYKPDGGDYVNEILDIRASAGANCVVTRFKNYPDNGTVNSKARGKAMYGDYLCVAGTGWNGTLKVYRRDFDGTKFSDIDLQDLVCAPKTRAYRYYILGTSDVDDLDDQIDWAGVSSSITSIVSTTSSSLVGQSGLVRFYPTAASRSSEGVLWDDYFWHNPDFLVNPSAALASVVSGGTYAYEGYYVPSVIDGQDNIVNLPGDIAYQNFVMSLEGNGGSAWTCGNVIANFQGGAASVATASPNTASNIAALIPAAPDLNPYVENIFPTVDGSRVSYLDHAFKLKDLGMPGYNSQTNPNYGYIPSSASSSYVVTDYNKYDPSVSQVGVSILGYVLATNTISGQIAVPNTISGGYQSIVIGGNPEPVVSILCAIDPTVVASDADHSIHNYSCSVPESWEGHVYAYDGTSSSATSACSPGTNAAVSSIVSPTYGASFASESSSEEYGGFGFTFWTYWDDLLKPLDPVSSAYFSGLYISAISGAVTSDIEDVDIDFNRGAGCFGL